MKIRHVLLLTILTLSMLPSASGQVVEDTYVILFDQSHGQYFTPDLFKTAFDSLSLLENRFNTKIEIKTIDAKFNLTNLQGADLVIISNPSNNATIGTYERRALTEFVEKGGSTLYLGNPYDDNANITGNPNILNEFMDADKQTKATFQPSKDSVDKPTVLVDDFNNAGNSTYVIMDKESITAEAMYLAPIPGVANVSEILYYGTGVIDDELFYSKYESVLHGNASNKAYLVNEKYDLTVVSQKIYWMIGKAFSSGRTMAIGSTIMFSDLPYDENSKWIEQKDNLALFQNVIAWLLKLSPVEGEPPLIDQPFDFFVAFNVGIAVAGSLALALIVFAVFIFSGRMSISDITNIGLDRTKVKRKRGATTTSQSSATRKPKPSKPPKKQRRRGSVK